MNWEKCTWIHSFRLFYWKVCIIPNRWESLFAANFYAFVSRCEIVRCAATVSVCYLFASTNIFIVSPSFFQNIAHKMNLSLYRRQVTNALYKSNFNLENIYRTFGKMCTHEMWPLCTQRTEASQIKSRISCWLLEIGNEFTSDDLLRIWKLNNNFKYLTANIYLHANFCFYFNYYLI